MEVVYVIGGMFAAFIIIICIFAKASDKKFEDAWDKMTEDERTAWAADTIERGSK